MRHAIRRPMENGAFTLVELSIVLVIIGLLVGGVLAGQALIEQAKLSRVVSEYRGFQAAVATFRVKYNAIPGDMKNATSMWGTFTGDCYNPADLAPGTETCNGNGDGIVPFPGQAEGPGETYRAWQHMSSAGLVSGNFKSGGAHEVHAERGVNHPASSTFGGAGWQFMHMHRKNYPSMGYYMWNGKDVPRYVFVFQKQYPWWFNTGYGDGNDAGIMTPLQLYSIDSKIDDGKPLTGIVNSPSNGSWCYTGSAGAEVYNTGDPATNTRTSCAVLFDVGI